MLHTRYFCSHNINNLLKQTGQWQESTGKKKQTGNKRKHSTESESGEKCQKKYVKEEEPSQVETSNQACYVNPASNLLLQPFFLYQSAYENYAKLLALSQGNPTACYQFYNTLKDLSVKDYLASQLMSYIQSAGGAEQTRSDFNTPSVSSMSPAESCSVECSGDNLPTQNHDKTIVGKSVDVNQVINSQTMQNWCAKCNTYFRLTSDLVYHMRTFHRKEEKTNANTNTASAALTERVGSLNGLNVNGEKSNTPQRESKYLRCDICNEIFKEKHHLSRHMTSHR